jgi:hypothetical protein
MQDNTAPAPSIDRLLDVEAKLDRSFAVAIVAFLGTIAWPVALRAMELDGRPWVGLSILGWLAVCLVAYIWFAYAAMIAAGYVGRSRVLVAAWILLAPIVGMLVPMPLIGRIIQVSPLSLKFILASELRHEIHDRTFSD